MARPPDPLPGDAFPKQVPNPAAEGLTSPDSPPDSPAEIPDDPGEDWDPGSLTMLARWLTRSYLRAQADPAPEE